MELESRDPLMQVLKTIGNPIRKDAIEILSKSEMRFSELMASCRLDYDHDAGHFNYHLSDLMKKLIVKKVDNQYSLTKFGFKVAEMLNSLEKECSFLLINSQEKRGEIVKLKNITVNQISRTDFLRQFGKDVSAEEAKLPQEQKDRLEKFTKWGFPLENKQYYHPQYFIAKRGEEILGFIEFVSAIITSINPSRTVITQRVLIKSLLTTGPALPDQREEITQLLLTELEKQAEENGATSVEAININAEDEELLSVLRKLGFERKSVGYNLSKTYEAKTDPFISTISMH